MKSQLAQQEKHHIEKYQSINKLYIPQLEQPVNCKLS